MRVKIIDRSTHGMPSYQTEGSAGMDLRANIDTNLTLRPLERLIVKTGLSIELPQGLEAQIRPRSGLAIKSGITVLNSPGTIDSDYRGEICVVLINLSSDVFEIKNGDRIAQMVIAKYEKVSWDKVEVISETQRGGGGFGSTGVL
ncbi:dUTP diphosphatase [Ichthyobacterium seriolicida]|uniref:Deoxyuridine 5'-triphosphate nucleotidohydrolase n=1 Tax=Ichthyobacterium seriolicida TaxID=242600 RepID=A0A1J1E461_9FLAO|nr:dUTP diphosphatase [Ichthyobacterium seriolicida]BAV94836.1 deoxyuridine 5'-triphosphate nucleotidohydrolase [Ichthyobacterium seriolicida]